MRKFWGFYQNGSYQVGCNGATLYLYDSSGVELAKFKDIKYAYCGAFKPHTNVFVAKSTEGKLAVYDLDERKLIKKITVTTIGAQDGGFAFSYSGDLFYNIEAPVHSTETQLTVYDGTDFTKKCSYFADNKKMVLDHIEVYPDEIYLQGFMRRADGVCDYGFIAKFADGKLFDLRQVKTKDYVEKDVPPDSFITDYLYLNFYKRWELDGFTERSHSLIKAIHRETPKVSIKQIYEANANGSPVQGELARSD